jgi:hypothetical protein
MKKNNNTKYMLVYGLVGLLIGLVLGILLSTSFTTDGNAKGIFSTTPLKPAVVTVLNANYADCTAGDKSYFTFSWKPQSNADYYQANLLDNSNNLVELKLLSEDNIGFPARKLDPKNPSNVQGYAIITNNYCGDTFYLYIDTVKGNKTVTSQAYKFGWVN